MINFSSPIRGVVGVGVVMEECKTVQPVWRPCQPSPARHHQHLVIFSANFMPKHWKPQIVTSALHEAFKQNCFNKWFFGSLHANIDLLLVNFKIGTTSIYKQNYSWVRPAWTPQTCAQSGGYLNFPGRRAWKAEVSPTWNFEVGRSGGGSTSLVGFKQARPSCSPQTNHRHTARETLCKMVRV